MRLYLYQSYISLYQIIDRYISLYQVIDRYISYISLAPKAELSASISLVPRTKPISKHILFNMTQSIGTKLLEMRRCVLYFCAVINEHFQPEPDHRLAATEESVSLGVAGHKEKIQ